jgi:hypothetical protein
MSIKRRGFVRGLILAPAAQAALSAQQPAASAAPARPAAPNGPALLKTTGADLTAETHVHFFTPAQFAVLEKLGALLMPPLKGNPGALDAQAPEFLDFLVSVSPAPRQKLYRDGLDHLEAQAKQKFGKSFPQLDAQQADAIIRPLLTVRFWVQDRPQDHYQDFMAQVHDDLRTATTNSREWAEAAQKSGRRFSGGSQSRGFYWAPIDPVVGD